MKFLFHFSLSLCLPYYGGFRIIHYGTPVYGLAVYKYKQICFSPIFFVVNLAYQNCSSWSSLTFKIKLHFNMLNLTFNS